MSEKENTKKEWKYDAFISYRHVEPDAFVAGSIHKLLESYKVPSNLIKEKGNELKRTKIRKVFRDQEELPLTSNLNETIEYALENSDYLIAICSPRFGESLWCRKEVDTFIKLHGKEHVLAVLVDGEPKDSFPEVLLYEDKEVTKEDGTIETVRLPMEPLAANARGANNKERLKLLKTETLRLMAPMFGCSFDDLKQRHREQKMKRTIQLVSLAAAVCFAFGIVSTGLALKINHQNEQITEQNEYITAQNEQITAQNSQIVEQSKEIDRQYREALVNQANAVGDNARNLYEDGDRIGAIEKALSVFPAVGEDKPYLPKVEKVLADALHLYDSSYYMKPDRLLRCDTRIERIIMSPKGTRLVSADSGQTVVVWDTATGERLAEFSLDKDADEKVEFKDEDHIFLIREQQLLCYEISTGNEQIIDENVDRLKTVTYSSGNDRLLLSGNKGMRLYDAQSGKLVADVNTSSPEMASFSTSDVLLVCSHCSEIKVGRDQYVAMIVTSMKDEQRMFVYDTQNGQLVGEMPVEYDTVGCLKCYDNRIYFAANKFGLTSETKFDTKEFVTYIYAYEITNGNITPLWKQEFSDAYSRDIVVTNSGKSNRLALQFYDEIVTVNAADGSVMKRYQETNQIIEVYGYASSDLFSYFTKEGTFCAIQETGDEAIEVNFFDCNGESIGDYIPTETCTATIPTRGDAVTIYRYASSPKAERVEEYPEYTWDSLLADEDVKAQLEQQGININNVQNICYDEEQKFLGVIYYNLNFEVFRLDEQKKIVESCGVFKNFDSAINRINIFPGGEYMILAGSGEAYLFRTNDVDYQTQFPTEDMLVGHIYNYHGVNYDENCVYIADGKEMYKVPIYDRNEIIKYAKEQIQ